MSHYLALNAQLKIVLNVMKILGHVNSAKLLYIYKQMNAKQLVLMVLEIILVIIKLKNVYNVLTKIVQNVLRIILFVRNAKIKMYLIYKMINVSQSALMDMDL